MIQMEKPVPIGIRISVPEVRPLALDDLPLSVVTL